MSESRDLLVQEVKRLRRGRGVTAAKLEEAPLLLECLDVTTGVEGLVALRETLDDLGDSVEVRALRNALAIRLREPGTLTERRIAFATEVDRGVDTVQDYEDLAIWELAVRLVPEELSWGALDDLVQQAVDLADAADGRLKEFDFRALRTFAEVARQTHHEGMTHLNQPLEVEGEDLVRAELLKIAVGHFNQRHGWRRSRPDVAKVITFLIEATMLQGRLRYLQGWANGVNQARGYAESMADYLETDEAKIFWGRTQLISTWATYPWPVYPYQQDGDTAAPSDSDEPNTSA